MPVAHRQVSGVQWKVGKYISSHRAFAIRPASPCGKHLPNDRRSESERDVMATEGEWWS
jgi:hypothetical protein